MTVMLALVVGLAFAQTDDVSYLTEADTRVQESNPDVNYAHRGLWTDGTTSDRKESYLRFRVSGVSEGSLKSARLRVHSYEGTQDGPALYQTTDEWSEKGLTWANRPATIGPKIDDAGGVAKGSWVEYDVSGVVEGDGTYSFVLRSDSAGLAKFDAWEGFHQPELVVAVEGDPILVGAGDIASGENNNDSATAALIRETPGTVFTVGDVVYESGSLWEFENYYGPTWGTEKARTKPSPGNHEYVGGDPKQYGAGYFDYFGAVAAKANGGSYSYDLGEWHIVSLNTGQCYEEKEVDGSLPGCSPGDPMIEWLKRDLANDARCTLAYFHHPRYSSGVEHGSDPAHTKAIWDALYADNAEVVVSGHDHSYERFAPQDPEGNLDEERGIRQFVVGTGGRSLRGFGEIEANSEVHNSDTYGVIKFTLHPDSYDWEFVPVEAGAFQDTGTGQCNSTDAPPAAQPPRERFVTNATLGTSAVPVKLSWTATDGESDIAEYQLQRIKGDGSSYQEVSLSSATSTSETLYLVPGKSFRYRVRARDAAGNWSDWAYGSEFAVDALQETSETIAYEGTSWMQETSDEAYGGSRMYAVGPGETAKFTFEGREIAWVAVRGSDHGQAEVWLDGAKIRTVDLYSPSALPRRVVFRKSWDSSETHTLEVKVFGTEGRPRVDVDAFVTIR
jgi:hypothetical protein